MRRGSSSTPSSTVGSKQPTPASPSLPPLPPSKGGRGGVKRDSGEANDSRNKSSTKRGRGTPLSLSASPDRPSMVTGDASVGSTFNWLTSFPGPDELEHFIKSTLRNASIARTCLKEAAETKERLKGAVHLGEDMVDQCTQRIKLRNRNVAEYQAAVNALRSKVGGNNNE
mmetsp:Transcript_42712/g.49486  ORF Transcript_42712/g.49486 Transcript_42712/m.49486 type:complete len:170 (-) Transcript_42712:46-555(-)